MGFLCLMPVFRNSSGFTLADSFPKISIEISSEKAKIDRYNRTCRFFGASVLTELNEKRSKIKGFRQSINGINLKIKYFSFQNTLRY